MRNLYIQEKELEFVDEDIREIFKQKEHPTHEIGCAYINATEAWFIGTPTVMQLVKELRLLRIELQKSNLKL